MRRPPPSALTAEQALEAIQRELIENLRRNLLRPGEREMLAAELERLWFPASKAVKDRKAHSRAKHHEWVAELYRREINAIAAKQKITKADAKLIVVKRFALQSVEALETYVRRAPPFEATTVPPKPIAKISRQKPTRKCR